MRVFTGIFSIALLLTGSAPAALGAAGAGAAKKTAAPSKGKKPAASKGKRSSRGRRPVARVRGQAAPTVERLREVQEALARSGHYRGKPTGHLDASTTAALGAFQQANGLDRTGRLGALTLKKLEQHGLPANSTMTAAEQTGGPMQ